jgi:hypothetical protein
VIISVRTRRSLLAVLSLGAASVAWPAGWQPPKGIPRPTFGIEESHTMFVGQTYDYNGVAAPYGDAGNGPFSHYVDNTHSAATDSSNPFGTPAKPRLTIPVNLTPGSVVELHGGPYNYITPGQNEQVEFATGRASAAQPIFIRGFSRSSKTEFTRRLRIIGSYFIIENLLFTDAGGLSIRAPSDHIGVRHTELTRFNHPAYKSHYNLLPGGDKMVDFNSDIVYSFNHLHDNGYPATTSEQLKNSFQVTGNTRRIWIVDNTMENGTEDGIHIMLGTSTHENYLPDGIYVGRNVIHHYTENAIDVKPSRNVIISENTMFGYRPIDIPPSDGASGDCVVLNYEDGPPPGQVMENHFIIFNRFFDSEIGIRAAYAGFVYGNEFHDINPTVAGSASSAVLLYLQGAANGSPSYVANNTIHRVSRGIFHRQGVDIYAHNNLITEASDAHIQYQNVTVREFYNNLLWNPDGKAVLKRGGSGAIYYRGLSTFPNPAEFAGCIEQDPLLASTDPSSPSYLNLTGSSPAVESGTNVLRVPQLLERFETAFGLDVALDFLGVPRPQKVRWDIGAHEYVDPADSPSITSFVASPASVEPGQPSTLKWHVVGATTLTIDNGVGVVTGDSVVVTPSSTTTYTLTASNGVGSTLAHAVVTVVGAPPPATGFYPLPPCRVLDTRVASGVEAAAPAFAAKQRRTLIVTGKCGLPVGAKAISANVTVVGAEVGGELRATGGHLTSTATSMLAIPVTRARANNAIIELDPSGAGTIAMVNDSFGTVHVVVDINGYFQ